MKLLIAEDDASLRKVLVTILQKNNYSVAAVDNGGDALDAMRTGLYDAAMRSVEMPKSPFLKVLTILQYHPKHILILPSVL